MILKDWLDKNYTKEEQINLINIDCYSAGITTLEGIELLVDLETLHCSDNKLTSLEGIENLDKLKLLYCHTNPLPYSNLEILDKIKLEVKKEVRQDKIKKLLNSVL